MKKIRVLITVINCDELGDPIEPIEGKKYGSVCRSGDTPEEIAYTLNKGILMAHELALKEIVK